MSDKNDAIDATTEELEHAMAFLMRWLEAIQRHRRYPLKRAHYLLLLLLKREGPQPAGWLAEALGLDASTVARQSAVMIEQGLIEKQPDPQDARSVRLRASRHGLVQMAAMREARLERIQALFADWRETDRRRFAALTDQLNRSLAAAVARAKDY